MGMLRAFTKSEATDMTAGKPWKVILFFAAPLLVGNLFQQLYNTVDAAVVGRFVGPDALAAVGASGPVINLMVGLFLGLATGVGILISQYFGARSLQHVQRTIHTAMLFTLIVGIGVTLIGVFGTPWILRLLQTPEDIHGPACQYLFVIFGGITISMYYNMVAAILRALGDSVTPLLGLGIASVLNAGLDILFVWGFGGGVASVAWATITAQLFSVVFSLWRLMHMADYTRLTRDVWKPDWAVMGRTMRLGLPTAVQQTAFSLGMMLIQVFINGFGKTVMASYVVVMKVDALCILPITSLGIALTTYTGQNIGARKLERVEQGTRHSLFMGVSIVCALSLLMFFFGKYPLMLFTKSEALQQESMHLLRILCPFYWTLAISELLGGVMRGAGNTVVPMVTSVTCLCLIRIPLLLVLVRLMQSADALYWSMVIGWFVGAAVIFTYYRRGSWRKKAELALEKAGVSP